MWLNVPLMDKIYFIMLSELYLSFLSNIILLYLLLRVGAAFALCWKVNCKKNDDDSNNMIIWIA